MQASGAMNRPETTMFLLEELHKSGVTYQRVANEIGVTWMSVHRWAKGFSRPRPALPVNTELARMLAENLAQNQAILAAKT
jgi:transposase-like protein